MKEIKPLKGIKIVDFTRLLPGPLGTHILSTLGAEVIKIESPQRLDYTRFNQPQINGVSTLFHSLNCYKKQLIVDYETPEGYQKVIAEIKVADVLIEQFRPGTMQSFNLSYDFVKSINPTIVYISVTGYGQTGENKLKAGHDLNFLAETGLLSMNKDEQGKPIIPGFQMADIAGGSYMLVAACTSGILAQKKTQKPTYLDISLTDATFPMGAIPHGMLQGGFDYNQTPFLSGFMVNYNVYECADNKWIALAAFELKFWNLFCEMVNKPTWKAENELQLSRLTFEKSKLEKLFKTKSRDEWVEASKNYDICLSPVLELHEIYNQKQTVERNVFDKVQIDNKTIEVYSNPYKTYSD